MEQNLEKFIVRSYERFLAGLKQIEIQETEGLKKLREILSLLRLHLAGLKERVEEFGFASDAERVLFFKVLRPNFCQWQVYYLERFALRNSRPAPTRLGLIKYYQDQLAYYDRFLRLNAFHFHYYKLGACELDGLYFLPAKSCDGDLVLGLPDLPEVDGGFSTPMSYLFSKFMAYEKLQAYLAEQLAELERPSLAEGLVVSGAGKNGGAAGLRWTGEKVHLIELAYALFFSGQVEGGQLGVMDFFARLGDCFKLDLGIPKRGFDDLKSRKRLSRTHFLEQLQKGLEEKFEASDEFKGGRLG